MQGFAIECQNWSAHKAHLRLLWAEFHQALYLCFLFPRKNVSGRNFCSCLSARSNAMVLFGHGYGKSWQLRVGDSICEVCVQVAANLAMAYHEIC